MRLEIEGRIVEVGEEFNKLDDAGKQATVDEIANSFTKKAPKEKDAFDKFAEPFKKGNWEEDSLIAPAIKYTAGSIAPDTFKGWKEEGQQNLVKKGKAIAQGVSNLVQNPVETIKGVASNIADNPAGFAGEMAKSALYDPELLLLPGGPGMKGTARALEGAGSAIEGGAKAVAKVPGQVVRGAEKGITGYGESALEAIDPAKIKLAQDVGAVTPRQAFRLENNQVPKEGQFVQAVTEDITKGYNFKENPIQATMNAAMDFGPMMAGVPIPLNMARRVGSEALNKFAAGRARGALEKGGAKVETTDTGGMGAFMAPKNTQTGTINVDAPTAPMSPEEFAKMYPQPVNKSSLPPAPPAQLPWNGQQTLAGGGGVMVGQPEAKYTARPAVPNQPVEPGAQQFRPIAPIKPEQAAASTVGNGGVASPEVRASIQEQAISHLKPELKQQISGNKATPQDILAQIRARGTQAENTYTPEIQAALNEARNVTAPATPATAPATPASGIEALRQKLMNNPPPQNLFNDMPMSAKEEARHSSMQEQLSKREEAKAGRKTSVHEFDLQRAADRMTNAKTDYERKIAEIEYNRLVELFAKTGGMKTSK